MTREEYLEKLRFMESMYHSRNTSFEVVKQFSEHIQVFRNLIDQYFDLKRMYDNQSSVNKGLLSERDFLIAQKEKLEGELQKFLNIDDEVLEAFGFPSYEDYQSVIEQYNKPTVKPTQDDPINPIYYNDTKITPWDVIDDWGLDFYLGSAMKYIKRAGKKEGNSTVQDLHKVKRYVEKEIELADKEANQ